MCKLFFWCGRPRGTHCAFEITLSWAITLTLLLVCAFSPRVHSIPWGPRYYALAFELHKLCGHEHQQSGNAASFLAENEKKTIFIVFSVGAVDGTCSATLRAQAVLRLFLRR